MSIVQDIKNRISIEDLISSYIQLEKAGSNLKAKCPFHNEKTPSFFVSPDRGSYYCFGCAEKGDIFTFVEKFEGLDFRGALKLLAEKVGIRLEDYNFNKTIYQENISEKERLYEAMEEATKFFENNLTNNNDNNNNGNNRGNRNKAMEYLKFRGIKDETIKAFRIGLANDSWDNLYKYLLQKGFSVDTMKKAGLIKSQADTPPPEVGGTPTSGGGGRFYDRFRNRIIFPISDSSGRVIAFSGRIFNEEKNDKSASAKYLNSPETEIFHKSSVLYGIDKAKDAIRKNDFSIIVEGQIDLVLSHQAGYKNTLAVSGTALASSDMSNNSINNLGIVKRLSPNIVFVFDADQAGLSALLRAATIALSLEMNTKASQTEEGLDPADLISKKGVDAWRDIIKNSKHIIEFLIDKFISWQDTEKKKDPLKIKLIIQDKIIPYLAYINNPIKRSHFISMLSHKSGIREEDIREILSNNINKNNMSVSKFNSLDIDKENVIMPNSHNKSRLRKDQVLRRLIGIILWQNAIGKRNGKRNIAETLTSELNDILKDDFNDILQNIENKEDLIFEAEVFYGENASGAKDKDYEKDAREMVFNLKEEFLKEELVYKMRDLHKAETEKNNAQCEQILKECKIINDEIEKIKSRHNV